MTREEKDGKLLMIHSSCFNQELIRILRKKVAGELLPNWRVYPQSNLHGNAAIHPSEAFLGNCSQERNSCFFTLHESKFEDMRATETNWRNFQRREIYDNEPNNKSTLMGWVTTLFFNDPEFGKNKMEEENENRRILNEVFGESSSEYDGEEEELQTFELDSTGNSLKWEQIKEIKGLWLCKDFLSLEQQSSLLLAIENEGWFTEDSRNQAMRFGDLPVWATKLGNYIRETVLLGDIESCHLIKEEESCPMPSHLLWREPLFDQLIVNVYQPGEGICAHVDLMRFEDGIAIISLESSCVMHFTRGDSDTCCIENRDKKEAPQLKIPILLTSGSLILMCGEARYLWKHEINRKPGVQLWGGQEIDQQKRTSVTLRKLCQPE
ncbi:2-oxoglutarate (2OG) and Fe(II)-dependent oxygenase superfamily protein [Thalictrum thalictroides]|uniref:2-oxoglutarate (2OG) and Fe(II)-dependent oxygenase superfamily protein n=1 Tax=Thalictrum thalictroides TaxID=46969 RepID=A0A7J6WL74_THATH|nr:2-oxoglutarate (2OG) and Fe(II)-dependent oxygenase superfamily protein [Thalictrum thalictroides]